MLISKQQPLLFVSGAPQSETTFLSFVLRSRNCVEVHHKLQVVKTCLVPGKAAGSSNRQRPMITAGATGQTPQSREKPGLREQTSRTDFRAGRLSWLRLAICVIHKVRGCRAAVVFRRGSWQRRKLATEKRRIPLEKSTPVWVNYHPAAAVKLWNRVLKFAIDMWKKMLSPTELRITQSFCGPGFGRNGHEPTAERQEAPGEPWYQISHLFPIIGVQLRESRCAWIQSPASITSTSVPGFRCAPAYVFSGEHR